MASPGARARYRRNYEALVRGMSELGFQPYLAPEDRGYVITTYRYPAGDGFRFEEFYSRLSELGFIIYPGKLSQELCFRIGTIGRLDVTDIQALIGAIAQVMKLPNSLVTKHLDQLAQKSLLERSIDSEDSRRIRISLTKKGIDLMNGSDDILAGMVERRLARIPDDQRTVFIATLVTLAGDSEKK